MNNINYACDYVNEDTVFYASSDLLDNHQEETDNGLNDMLVKPRDIARSRRKHSANSQKHANKLLGIVYSRANKANGFDDSEIFLKKCKNAEKKAQRVYQIVIDFSFPECINKIKCTSIKKLITDLCDLQWYTKSKEMADACEKAISTLEIARIRDGELVALYKEENVLIATIGFYDKVKMSDFEKDISGI